MKHKNINYKSFMNSSFVEYLKKNNISTFELCSFINTLLGAENFIKNHPIPIKKYYEDNLFYVGYDYFFEANNSNSSKFTMQFTTKDIEKNITQIKAIDNLSTEFIIQNEYLWNLYAFEKKWHQKFSSDDWEYYKSYKTGWAYLAENKSIILDMQLISFFKDKTVPVRYESMGVLAGKYENPQLKEKDNCLNLFKNHKIQRDCIPCIINDPITWEGIFYNQDFCNESILAYIRNLIPYINKDINLDSNL